MSKATLPAAMRARAAPANPNALVRSELARMRAEAEAEKEATRRANKRIERAQMKKKLLEKIEKMRKEAADAFYLGKRDM